MLDYLIRSGTSWTAGRPGRQGDVGVRDGRIVAVGQVDEPAAVELDATGLVVAPGWSTPTPTTTPSCSGTLPPHRPTCTA